MQVNIIPYELKFNQPAGTSRGVLHYKKTWFIVLKSASKAGIGECNCFQGLSYDDVPHFEQKLQEVKDYANRPETEWRAYFKDFPSILFGLETALDSLCASDPMIPYPSPFTKGEAAIPINGLIWMGKAEAMRQQIAEKIEQGFRCIKLKIGAIDFEEELNILKGIRKSFSPAEVELRVDANGAFAPETALEKLKRLSEYDIHSIEQPVKPIYQETLAALCTNSPIDIALDESLIGVLNFSDKKALLECIKPQYLIFKPALIGGFKAMQEWITLCATMNIAWWITSALESNIGLNSIAQYTARLKTSRPQGLGTGGLFTNNIKAPLVIQQAALRYQPKLDWDSKIISFFDV
ncbi:MAG: o-succinylbenzoate synthase [Flavobacteriaceae bacterium]|nr:o-succinylbenzoate synthase [Flavobacteriaceae bacterium]